MSWNNPRYEDPSTRRGTGDDERIGRARAARREGRPFASEHVCPSCGQGYVIPGAWYAGEVHPVCPRCGAPHVAGSHRVDPTAEIEGRPFPGRDRDLDGQQEIDLT